MKFAIHTRAGRVVSVTWEGHQWLFRFPEGSLGKEPTIAEAEYRSEKAHDPELEKQARDEAIKEAVKQGWTKSTCAKEAVFPTVSHFEQTCDDPPIFRLD